ncbi:hypothetical protein LCGC14_1486470 [marine sediment metagenome]|uniref:Uncharacterized protein n=1 Tax=marine sediment metagenome TaxID=412755 RepID=A0A0F9LNP8_9ZZZZ
MEGFMIGSMFGIVAGLILIRKLEKRSERKWQDWMKENGVTKIG